jgi:hypothetical protein
MGSFEWMELQTLTSEITTARSRLAAARSSKNVGRVRGLEEEITAAEARHSGLLAHITTNLVDISPRISGPKTTDRADALPAPLPVEEAVRETDAEQESGASANRNLGNDAASPAPPPERAPPPQPSRVKGDLIMWDRLTPGDIARATNELGMRRAAALARHAEELKELNADQTQIDSLEQAITAFVWKLNRLAPEGNVAALGEDRGLRLQAHG